MVSYFLILLWSYVFFISSIIIKMLIIVCTLSFVFVMIRYTYSSRLDYDILGCFDGYPLFVFVSITILRIIVISCIQPNSPLDFIKFFVNPGNYYILSNVIVHLIFILCIIFIIIPLLYITIRNHIKIMQLFSLIFCCFVATLAIDIIWVLCIKIVIIINYITMKNLGMIILILIPIAIFKILNSKK